VNPTKENAILELSVQESSSSSGPDAKQQNKTHNKMKCIFLLTALIAVRLHQSNGQESDTDEPNVQVTLLVRNKAETGVLPYFLSYFEDLAYDKQKISLW
jgi:hypothetical protein